MRIFLHGRQWRLRAALSKLLGVAAIVAGTLPGSVLAQAPGGQESVVQPGKGTTGFKPDFNLVQEHPARPQGGRDGIDAMISAHSTSGEIEIIAGQGRMVSLRQEIARDGRNRPLLAVGSPGVVDIEFINSKMLRLTGRRAGRTDLTILTDRNETYVFKVTVVYDLTTLRSRLSELFPDASVKIKQNLETIYVSGEVRDAIQMRNVLRTVQSHIDAEQSLIRGRQGGQGGGQPGGGGPTGGGGGADPNAGGGGQPGDPFAGGANPNDPNAPADPGTVNPTGGGSQQVTATLTGVQIINLLRIPGSQQVLLKCRLAEINRTAFRQMGFTFTWANTGTTFTQSLPAGAGAITAPITGAFVGAGNSFSFALDALRQNNMAKILAEPELMTMSGHPASFLVGGEIPVPVPQGGSAAGGGTTITVEFRQFGTRLEFVPLVMDKEMIRLTVTPEVSQPNFALAVAIAPGAGAVPGFTTRRASTTVELKEGQTLALAGLMQLTQNSNRNSVPLAGDLPYLGTLFRRNNFQRQEQELVIAVTPHLVEPMSSTQTPRMPGEDVNEPNDLELYLLGRNEGRTGRDNRATTKWDDPIGYRRIFNLEKRKVSGVGFSE